jgi:hypothetical protein
LAWLALVAALGGALASLPIWPGPSAGAPLDVLLVDVSASVVRTRPDWLPFVRGALSEAAERARDEGREVEVWSYADGVARLFGPGPADEFANRLRGVGGPLFDPLSGDLDDSRTDLCAALERAAGSLAESARVAGRVVLVGADGCGPRAPEPLLAQLASQGVELEHAAPPDPTRPDLGLLELRGPAAPEPGAPLGVWVEVAVRGRVPGVVLDFEVSRAGQVERRRIPWPGPFQDERICRAVALGPTVEGSTRIELSVAPQGATADAFPENDRRLLTVPSGGRRALALLVDRERRSQAEAFVAASRGLEGLDWEILDPGDAAPELERFDAFVAWDPDPDGLPLELIGDRVRQGAGFATLAGWRAPSMLTDPRAADLVALEPAPRGRPPRQVLLLVDGSGSMAGETFEEVRRAAVELAAAIPAEDRAALRFFTGVLHPPVSLELDSGSGGRSERRAEVARRVLGARRPSGPTALLASLESLAAERAAAPAGEGLVVMLTDGREEGDPVREVERRAALVESFAASRTALRVLALGERVELETLAPLVSDPSHLVRVGERSDLAQLVVRTVLVEDLARGPRVLVRGGGSLVDEVLGPAQRRASGSEPAALDPAGVEVVPVELLQPARPVAGAEAAWVDRDGAAALGLARAGPGRLATLASLPEVGWSEALARDPLPLAPVLRWLAERPPPGAARARVESGVDGGPWVVVAGLGPEVPAELDLELAPIGPDGGLGPAVQLRAGPGPIAALWDERQAPLELEAGIEVGDARLSAELPGGRWSAILPLPPPAECLEPRPLPGLPAARPAPGARRGPHGAAPALLAAALAAGLAFAVLGSGVGLGFKGPRRGVR